MADFSGFQRLFPPDDPVRTWRWLMGGSVMSLAAVMYMHMAGFLPGETGNASMQQVLQIEKKVDRLDKRLLERQIIEWRIRQCTAIEENNATAKQTYAQGVAELLADFEALTGTRFHLPSCSEL